MKFLPLILPLIACSFLAVSTTRAVPTKDPEGVLKSLVQEQKSLFASADKNDPNFDQENFRSQLQQICNRYDGLLRDYPNMAAAYVAYGMLLNKVDMRKESAAMLLQANRLDKNLPLVKNQLGNYLAEEGRPLEAVTYFLSAIDLDPKEPLYHYQLGTLLTEAREDFLQSGQWTRANLDQTMHDAFHRAMELDPENPAYAYRYGESFYDLEKPDWDAALEYWRGLELKVAPGIEKQTIRLHEANVLIKQQKFSDAEKLIQTVNEKVLEAQKQKLIAQLPVEKQS